MEIRRDSVNRHTKKPNGHTIRFPLKDLKGGYRLKEGDEFTIVNVVEHKLFHDPEDTNSPVCTIKDANEVKSEPNADTAYGEAVFDPNGWQEGDPVFDPNVENS